MNPETGKKSELRPSLSWKDALLFINGQNEIIKRKDEMLKLAEEALEVIAWGNADRCTESIIAYKTLEKLKQMGWEKSG